MSSAWEQLLCPYFAIVSRQVLNQYFIQHGFKTTETGIGGLLFSKNDVFVEISYDPQTYPNYSPTLLIGVLYEISPKIKKYAGVPLWYVLASDSEEQSYSFWKFTTVQELETIMRRILTQIAKQYMEELWNNPILLKEKVENFSNTLIFQ